MFRRNFLKTIIVGIGTMFIPKKHETKKKLFVKPMDPEVMKRICNTASQGPYLPTMEWLREHNPNIASVAISMHETGCAVKNIYVMGIGPSAGAKWTGYIYRKVSRFQNFDDIMLQIFWKDGKWIAVDQLHLGKNGSYEFGNQIDWPDWLRKF